jgi:hypothetical protein
MSATATTPSTTVNFTGAVDRDLLKRAKIVAAKNDTSINALFNAELRYLVETFDGAENSGNQNYKNLVAFSLGQATAAQTLERLGTDSVEDLFLLMAQAHLPMPRLPDVATQAMVQSLHQLPTELPSAKRATQQAKAQTAKQRVKT